MVTNELSVALRVAPRRAYVLLAYASAATALSACMLLLLAPAIWNGYPLLQYDTGGYLARWFEGYLVPSRPAAYGLLLAASSALDFWPVLLVQATATIWIVGLVLRAHDVDFDLMQPGSRKSTAPFSAPSLGRRLAILLTVLAVLSVVTTLPWLTGILLTDIFAGLAILALHLVVFRADRLSGWERPALIVFIGFAIATHSATFGMLALMAAGGLALWLLRRDIIPAGGLRHALIAVALGCGLTLSANAVVAGKLAWTPGGYGILFGRMLEAGIVDRYLADHCPDPQLRLCPRRKTLPRNADAFLWGGSDFDKLGRFDGLGAEMRQIVLGSVRDYPLMQLKVALGGILQQLVSVRSGEGVIDQIWHTYGIMKRYTPETLPAMRAARQQHGGIGFDALNLLHVPVALFAILLLPTLIWAGMRSPALAPFGSLAATIGAALLANAFVCGALANPHDRYGARLAWIAVLAVIIAGPAALSRWRGRARTYSSS